MQKICFGCGIKYRYDHVRKCKQVKDLKIKSYKFLLYLMQEINMPWKPVDENYAGIIGIWNGEYLPVYETLSGPRHDVMEHEIAHWLIATEQDRKHRMFNLTGNDIDIQNEKYVRFLEKSIDYFIMNSYII